MSRLAPRRSSANAGVEERYTIGFSGLARIKFHANLNGSRGPVFSRRPATSSKKGAHSIDGDSRNSTAGDLLAGSQEEHDVESYIYSITSLDPRLISEIGRILGTTKTHRVVPTFCDLANRARQNGIGKTADMNVLLHAVGFDTEFDQITHAEVIREQSLKLLKRALETGCITEAQKQAIEHEVRCGTAAVEQDWDGGFRRVVAVEVLRLKRRDGNVLVELGRWRPSSGVKLKFRLPGNKRATFENPKTFVKEVVGERFQWVNLAGSDAVHVSGSKTEIEEEVSRQFGMLTRYHRTIHDATVERPIPKTPSRQATNPLHVKFGTRYFKANPPVLVVPPLPQTIGNKQLGAVGGLPASPPGISKARSIMYSVEKKTSNPEPPKVQSPKEDTAEDDGHEPDEPRLQAVPFGAWREGRTFDDSTPRYKVYAISRGKTGTDLYCWIPSEEFIRLNRDECKEILLRWVKKIEVQVDALITAPCIRRSKLRAKTEQLELRLQELDSLFQSLTLNPPALERADPMMNSLT